MQETQGLPEGRQGSEFQTTQVVWGTDLTLQKDNKQRIVSFDLLHRAGRQSAGLLGGWEGSRWSSDGVSYARQKPLCASKSWGTREERDFVRYVSRVKSWSSSRMAHGPGAAKQRMCLRKFPVRFPGGSFEKDTCNSSGRIRWVDPADDSARHNKVSEEESCDEGINADPLGEQRTGEAALRDGCSMAPESTPTTSAIDQTRLKLHVNPGNRKPVLDLRVEMGDESPAIVGYPEFMEFAASPVSASGTPVSEVGDRPQTSQIYGSKPVNRRMERPVAGCCQLHENPAGARVKRVAAIAHALAPDTPHDSTQRREKVSLCELQATSLIANVERQDLNEGSVSQDLDSARNKRNDAFAPGAGSTAAVGSRLVGRSRPMATSGQRAVHLRTCSVPTDAALSPALGPTPFRLQDTGGKTGSYERREDSAADLPVGVWGNPDFGRVQGLRVNDFDPVTWPGSWDAIQRRSKHSGGFCSYGQPSREPQYCEGGRRRSRKTASGSLSMWSLGRSSVSVSCPLPDRWSVDSQDMARRGEDEQATSVVWNLLGKLFRCRCRSRDMQLKTIGGDEEVARSVANESVDGGELQAQSELCSVPLLYAKWHNVLLSLFFLFIS